MLETARVGRVGARRRGVRTLDRGRVAHDLEATGIAKVRLHASAEQVDQVRVTVARVDDDEIRRRSSASIQAAPPFSVSMSKRSAVSQPGGSGAISAIERATSRRSR